MHGVTDVNGCDARTTCCMSSATTAAALQSSTSSTSAAVRLQNSTCYMTDIINPALTVIDNKSKNSANTNKPTFSAVDNSIDTTTRRCSASLDILQTPENAVSLVPETVDRVSSSSISEPMTTASPFHFSVAGYNFQKYTAMVIVAELMLMHCGSKNMAAYM